MTDSSSLGAPTVIMTGVSPLQLATAGDAERLRMALPMVECVVADPLQRLGRKGLRQKDRATQLALCAAVFALEDAQLPIDAATQLEPDQLAVVVSSNTGNIDTVCRAVAQIRSEGVSGTSPLDLPNASSNVIASTVAIRIGARQANLMVCNGATSGLDAIHLARNLIAAGRAQRVLVVSVEVDNAQTQRLFAETHVNGRPSSRLTEASIAIVLENSGAAAERGRTGYAQIGRTLQAASAAWSDHLALLETSTDVGGAVQAKPIWFAPASLAQLATLHGLQHLAFDDAGDFNGTLGLIQAASAATCFRGGGRRALLTCGGSRHGEARCSLILAR